jgi:hypothetical protein
VAGTDGTNFWRLTFQAEVSPVWKVGRPNCDHPQLTLLHFYAHRFPSVTRVLATG